MRENPEPEGSGRQTNDPEKLSIVIEQQDGRFATSSSSSPSVTKPTIVNVSGHETSLPTSSSSSSSSYEWLNAILKDGSSELQRPKIPRVWETLRCVESNFKGCFDPIVVSIGPYHHGKPNLQEFEDFKIQTAKKFVAKIEGQPIHAVYDKVKGVAIKASEYYDYDIESNEDMEKFTRMMFLDGCFILEFMLLMLTPERCPHMGMKRTHIQRDLFLLENQLPYIVLEALMSMRFEGYEGKKMIDEFIKLSHSVPTGPTSSSSSSCLNSNLLCFGSKHKATSSIPGDIGNHRQDVHHLLQLMREHLVNPADDTSSNNNGVAKDSVERVYYSHHSATDLNNVGITFKPNKTGKFHELGFTTRFLLFGELTLAPLIVDDFTKSILLNMVSCEIDTADGCDITYVRSYICLMSSLLRHPEDVKVLTSHNILFDHLGNERQVVDMFHHMSNNLVPVYPHSYIKAYTGISKHFRNKVKLLIAEWLHAHFSTSWTVLAFLGAVFAIALALIQTYFEANPPK